MLVDIESALAFTYNTSIHILETLMVGIVLAGGSSTRAKLNKLLLEVDRKPLICHTINTISPFVDKVIVVTGKYHDELIKVAYKLKELTLCTLTTAFKTMVPNRLKVSSSKSSLAKYNYEVIINKDANIKEYIDNHKKASKQIEILNKLLNKEKLYTKDIPSNIVKIFKDNNLINLEKEAKYRINKDIKLRKKCPIFRF